MSDRMRKIESAELVIFGFGKKEEETYSNSDYSVVQGNYMYHVLEGNVVIFSGTFEEIKGFYRDLAEEV